MEKMAEEMATGLGMRFRLGSNLMEKLDANMATGGLGMQLGTGSDVTQKMEASAGSGPREGLMAWWSFDGSDDSGPEIDPPAGPGDQLLLSQSVAGVFGRALRLHLTPLVMTNLSRLTERAWEQITVSAWVMPIGITDRQDVHYRKDYHYLFLFQPGGRILTFSLNLDGKNQELNIPINPADFSDGRWRLLTATYDGTAIRVYQDGTEIACRAAGGMVSKTAENTALIGSQKGVHDAALNCCPQARLYDGYLDDVRVYNRALSGPEIAALFAAGAANISQCSSETQHPAQESETRRSQTALQEVMRPIDPVERTQRAMRGFMSQVPVRMPGPEGYYRAIFYGQLLPHARRDSAQWDFGDCTARAVRAWYYLREITGDTTTGTEVEQGERRLLLSIINPKTGLVYVPDRSNKQKGTYYYHCWDQNRTLLALIWLYQNEPEQQETLRPVIERMIEGFDRFATLRGTDECWGPYAGWPCDEYVNDTPGKPYDDYFANNRVGPFIEPLVFWAEITGDEKYIDMAVRYANCELSGHQSDPAAPDKKAYFLFHPDGSCVGHFTVKVTTGIGIGRLSRYLADHGRAEEARRYLRTVRKTYDWIVAPTNIYRGGHTGWMPESWTPRQDIHETCNTSELMQFAEAMASCAHLDPEFHEWANLYDDIESFFVNTIARIQLNFTPEFETRLRTYYGVYGYDPDKQLETARRYDGVCISVIKPNDRYGTDKDSPPYCLVGCCHYSGMRAIHTAWLNAMAYEDGVLKINYLLKKNLPQATMTTEMPAQGTASISLHEAAPVLIRVPRWTQPGEMAIQVNGSSISVQDNLDPAGHYIRLGRLDAGTRIELSVPVSERVTKETICDREYTIQWRGNYVVKMDPQGLYDPIFP